VKVGDLVAVKKDERSFTPLVEESWIGVITEFRIGESHEESPDCRYAVVFWNDQYPQEEEYLHQLEVISENADNN
jgi:hypothetical protein